MFIDTHCHLNFKAFKKDLDDVIKRAQETGVYKIIIPGAKIGSSQKAVEIAQKFSCCYASIGVHPHHASSIPIDKLRELEREIIILTKQKRVVAIGEIGLDYFQYNKYPSTIIEDKKRQNELFLTQFNIALKHNLPVIIHSRNAHDDLLEVLGSFNKLPSGVFHCFDGTKEHLKKVLNLGFFVGFDGNITYPENSNLRELVKFTPLDRLLVETDSPFLTPLPFRGTRNEPSYIPLVAQAVAQIHKKKSNEIAEITSYNATKLFHL